MPKIVFIGAGSFGFTRRLVRDMLTFPLLKNAEIALVDINRERLSFAKRACEKIVTLGDYPARVVATTDRREVLKGADAVCVTILCGSTNVWQHDILIPKKYGIDTNVGDTRGPSGIFRALRTIPTMLDLCKDMEELCPNAIMLNYTNPMAMLCNAMQRTSFIQSTGLCHSVQGTSRMIANWVGVKPEKMTYLCAGINHMAWFLKLEHNGRDLYSKLKRVVSENKEVYNHEQVRNEMFLALGRYVTESSGHNSEYNWWFRKRPDLIRKYCTSGTGWNPGKYAYILNQYRNRNKTWKDSVREWLSNEDAISLKRGHEYAASIINARLGGELFEFNGNVHNTGLVTNLPEGACVEVPVLASRKGYSPIKVGALPDACAILTNLSAQIEMMVVEGCLTGDAELVYQAIAHDPLTAAKLSLAEIRKMVVEMFRKNKKCLPQFKKINL
ncbi:MAG TPA: alpha-glucosidase/alpha-galactosidase [Candidatus Latescibacteria bacterium]|nr:alpha-glucosidase/alpha-galactosidase [Candidatus Latescibacterota bacterium]|tara:strand:+ start:230 stop:1558 length:1329 start_codon:yes stop_codon:yes gene_type:complete